jgi:hypothetical protein
VKKPVKSSQKKFLLFLNTNPLPPVSLGFLNRQSQIPFRQAASGPGNLAMLSVAKGIASDALSKRRMQSGVLRFPSLPGLLGRWNVEVREALQFMAWFLVDAREAIEGKIIPNMADRVAALKLVEALVLAQVELKRSCDLDAD